MKGRQGLVRWGMQAAKQALLTAIPNAKSDHLAVVVAFDAWVRAGEQGGRGAASAFCSDNFISHQVLIADSDCVAPPASQVLHLAMTRQASWMSCDVVHSLHHEVGTRRERWLNRHYTAPSISHFHT